jgi:cytochrome c-type biogenesis protein CcmE
MTLWVRFLVVLFIVAVINAVSGCAVYSVANGVTYIATDKSITDHTTSKLATADCDAVRMAVKGTYYCEVRDISTTYNRNTF